MDVYFPSEFQIHTYLSFNVQCVPLFLRAISSQITFSFCSFAMFILPQIFAESLLLIFTALLLFTFVSLE